MGSTADSTLKKMSKFEDIAKETIQIKAQKGWKDVVKMTRASATWVNIKWSNIYVIGVPEW